MFICRQMNRTLKAKGLNQFQRFQSLTLLTSYNSLSFQQRLKRQNERIHTKKFMFCYSHSWTEKLTNELSEYLNIVNVQLLIYFECEVNIHSVVRNINTPTSLWYYLSKRKFLQMVNKMTASQNVERRHKSSIIVYLSLNVGHGISRGLPNACAIYQRKSSFASCYFNMSRTICIITLCMDCKS